MGLPWSNPAGLFFSFYILSKVLFRLFVFWPCKEVSFKLGEGDTKTFGRTTFQWAVYQQLCSPAVRNWKGKGDIRKGAVKSTKAAKAEDDKEIVEPFSVWLAKHHACFNNLTISQGYTPAIFGTCSRVLIS